MKRIILCRPAGPRNVGAILRAALNFGPAEVVIKGLGRPSLLVHPDFDLMSHGGEDARSAIQVVDPLAEPSRAATTRWPSPPARGRRSGA